MSNIDYLTSLIPQGHPYREMPPFFDLPEHYQDGYSRPWPGETMVDPYHQATPFQGSQRQLISRGAKYHFGDHQHVIPHDNPQQFHYQEHVRPLTTHNDYENRRNIPREYFPAFRMPWSGPRPPVRPVGPAIRYPGYGGRPYVRGDDRIMDMTMAQELMKRKDLTIMMLVGLAVVEGLVILSLAKDSGR